MITKKNKISELIIKKGKCQSVKLMEKYVKEHYIMDDKYMISKTGMRI